MNTFRSAPTKDDKISFIVFVYKLKPVPAKIRNVRARVYIIAVFLFLILWDSIFLYITNLNFLSLFAKRRIKFIKDFSQIF